MTSTYDDLHFSDITPEKLSMIRDYLKRNGASGADGNSGTASNECFSAQYDWNPASGLLKVTPLKLVPSLTPQRLTQLFQAIIAPAPTTLLLGAATIYNPHPSICAVYNWGIGFFTNNTDSVLTYSANATDHGLFTSFVNRISAGAKPADHTDGFWQNQSPKDSVQGSSGSVTYTFADGSTTLTISYSVNTLSATSASVGLAGQNAARYSASVDKQTSFYGAAAYLYPYVTVDFAT